MQLNEQINPFKCEFCNKTFKTGKALGGHKRVHIKKPSVCPICQEVFSSLGLLAFHTYKFHPRIKYTKNCIVCAMEFKTYKQKQLCCSITCFNKSPAKLESNKTSNQISAWKINGPWNRGLTKETSKKLAVAIDKMSKTKIDKYNSEEFHDILYKQRSDIMKNAWNRPECIEAMNNRNTSFITGWFNSLKNNSKLFFQSSYELLAYIMLENDKDVIKYGRCKFSIPYILGGEAHIYIPDIMVEYIDISKSILEIKPEVKLDDEMNIAKFIALEKYCIENLLSYKIITENILCNIANNITLETLQNVYFYFNNKDRFIANWKIQIKGYLNATE